MTATRHVRHLPYSIDEAKDRNHFFENHWKRVGLELLEHHAGNVAGWSLLDYGCGRGETMKYAADMGMQPSGLDTDPECVRLASQFGPADLLDVPRMREQVGEKAFDVVACFHVLEHVDNPKETLTALGRAAKRYVLTAVPNLQKIPNFRKPRAHPKPTNEGHLQSWDHSHFRNLAEVHCGLKFIAWGYDATQLPVLSELVKRTLGERAAIKLETGAFRKLFPYWGISVIGLWSPTNK